MPSIVFDHHTCQKDRDYVLEMRKTELVLVELWISVGVNHVDLFLWYRHRLYLSHLQWEQDGKVQILMMIFQHLFFLQFQSVN